MKKKYLLMVALLFAFVSTAFAAYCYYFNVSIILRQYVSPAVYTLDAKVLYTSITTQDHYDSGWITPQSWKTWGRVKWIVRFLNKDLLDDYFKEFLVEIHFNSEEHGTLEAFKLGFSETGEELEYSFLTNEPDYGNITLRITATPLGDLGLGFGEHEVILDELPLIEWCP